MPDHDAERIGGRLGADVDRDNRLVRCEVIRAAAQSAGALAERNCGCGRALEHAVMTAREAMPAEARERLKLLLGS